MKLSQQNIKLLVSVFLLFFTISFSANAQCKPAMKEGIKKLAPYMHNGVVNTVTVILDEPSEIHLSVYKGLNYKFQIGSEDALGKVSFRVLDEYKTEIYNSAGSNDPLSFVFFSNASQNLIVEIYPMEKGKQGCAFLVVGVKEPKNIAVRNL